MHQLVVSSRSEDIDRGAAAAGPAAPFCRAAVTSASSWDSSQTKPTFSSRTWGPMERGVAGVTQEEGVTEEVEAMVEAMVVVEVVVVAVEVVGVFVAEVAMEADEEEEERNLKILEATSGLSTGLNIRFEEKYY